MPPDLEEVRQEYEEFLNRLEQLAIQAIALGDWAALYTHIASFSESQGEASAATLDGSGADLFSQTECYEPHD